MKPKLITSSGRVGRRPRLRWLVALLTGVLGGLVDAPGMVFYSTGDPNFNTTAPTGALANSGWQWTGQWIGYQAVPIGPHHFLAARHVGGTVGNTFVLNGVSYVTTAYADDSTSDLRIWQVAGTFPDWAPLYRHADEVGRGLVVFGRGYLRGADVSVASGPYAGLKGWQWVGGDGRLRWGENTFKAVVNGGSYWGTLLYATFDQGSGTNEASLATGDSSGPIFINDGTGWKLAGVAATVDGYYNTTNSGNGFLASLFDSRGLYYSSTPPTGWVLVKGASAVPAGWYATRVSEHAAWIDSIVPPETGGDAPLLSPVQLGGLGVLLAAFGARALRRSAA